MSVIEVGEMRVQSCRCTALQHIASRRVRTTFRIVALVGKRSLIVWSSKSARMVFDIQHLPTSMHRAYEQFSSVESSNLSSVS